MKRKAKKNAKRIKRLQEGTAGIKPETAEEAKLRLHWQRVCIERRDALVRFLEAIPEAYDERVEPHLDTIIERLWVRGRAWAPEDYPAFVRWAVHRVNLKADHPHYRPLPNPIPGALIDLFLDNPDADTNYWCHCPHCKIELPFTQRTGEYPFSFQRSIADTCPLCKKAIPPPRTC
jgi:hypothetical protein